MQYFIDQIRILMPVLGSGIFRGRSTQEKPAPVAPVTPEETTSSISPSASDEVAESPDSPVFYMRTREGSDAQAHIIDGESTLLQGSAIPNAMKDNPRMAESTRKEFIVREAQHAKVLGISEPGPTPGLVTLSKNFVFTSPLAAASIGQVRWCGVSALSMELAA